MNTNTTNALNQKVDWDAEKKVIALPKDGCISALRDEETLEGGNLLAQRTYDEGATFVTEVGTTKNKLTLNASERPQIDLNGGKSENIAYVSDLPNCVRINIRDSKLTTEVHSKEDILGWFKCTTEAELKKKILSEVPMFLLYGISLTGNPMYYRMPIEYIAFESATQIKMVFSGLNTRDDVVSKYVIIMNLDGTVIGDSASNVSMTITSLENTSKVTELETKITELEQRLESLEGTHETV